ncbi:MAG: hypothetical protein WC661_08760 [Opitutaceae bacterium]|jgi:hypothetical protein
MNDDRKSELQQRLRNRIAFDKKWDLINSITSQILIGISILASFGAAIVAAANLASSLVVAFLASVPGTVITVDRSFRFAARWRWHCTLVARVSALEQKLTFQNGSVEDISRELSEYLEEMEKKYPSGALEWHSRKESH